MHAVDFNSSQLGGFAMFIVDVSSTLIDARLSVFLVSLVIPGEPNRS